MSAINEEGLAKVRKELEEDKRPLTFRDCYEIFGPEFYEMLIVALMDANDAARAIQGAVMRLSGKHNDRNRKDK